MNTEKLDNVVLELSGIRDQLFALSFQFGVKNEEPPLSNEVLSNILSSIGYHIGRIETELDDVSMA